MFSPTDSSQWQLEWNEGLSMLIREIDAEHQRFIHLINGLNEAIVGRMDVEEIKKRMQAILDAASAHFALSVLHTSFAYCREAGVAAADVPGVALHALPVQAKNHEVDRD